jgi:type II secretory pathway component PulJ
MQNINKAIYKLHKDESGQTLLFVVVAMTIALSIGINASVRTLSSLSRTSRTDTASRALAAAEGGIERYLALSTLELEHAIEAMSGSRPCPEGTFDSENIACLIEFEGSSDVLVSQAYVKVERYNPENYPFSLESGQIKEVNLYDSNTDTFYGDSLIEICWSSTPIASPTGSDIMYTSYNKDGIQQRGGITGANPPAAPYEQRGFDNAGVGKDGYDNCETVDIGSDIYGLRIRSVGGPSNIAVYPTSGNSLPLQGYRIESIGKIRQDQAVTASRAIKVVRTLPYLPVSFDYALYSEGGIVK